VRLVACRACHAQYDVTDVEAPSFECRCGATIRNETQAAVEAHVQRCSSCGALLPDDAARCDYCHAEVVRGGALPLICPECFARNADSAKFCGHCGVGFQPEPLPQEHEDAPSCPCCQEPLAVRGVGGVWVRECPKCNGLWVPGDRFDALIQRAVEAARQRAASGAAASAPLRARSVSTSFSYRNCPVCGERMYRKNFGTRSGVIIDWCGPHGTWLDADELEQVAAFIQAGGLRGAEPGAGAPGLSQGGRMNVDQFKAMVVGDRMLEQEREREERRSRSSGGASLLGLLVDLLR
jgi:Zn-finger nucleic acid-binding protein/ribosomal protein L40E